MAVVVAPAIGPTLGGYITDNYNWHWIFFINLPIGLISLWLSNRMVEDPPQMKERMKQKLPIDFTGLALVLTGGPAVVGFPSGWQALGGGVLLGVAAPLWVLLVCALGVGVLLSRTVWGRTLFLIGSGARAAEFAGLRTVRATVLSYVLTGVLAAVAGVLLSARTNGSEARHAAKKVRTE